MMERCACNKSRQLCEMTLCGNKIQPTPAGPYGFLPKPPEPPMPEIANAIEIQMAKVDLSEYLLGPDYLRLLERAISARLCTTGVPEAHEKALELLRRYRDLLES